MDLTARCECTSLRSTGTNTPGIATAIAQSTAVEEGPVIVSSYYWISKSASDDVRWERVEQIRLMLSSKGYPVAPEQVAARLIEHMLNLSRVK